MVDDPSVGQSCCLMVGYVIVGGMIFQRLEAEHGRAVDNDMQRVKDRHVLWLCGQWTSESVSGQSWSNDRHVMWLWNLTAAMNVLHPVNWSTTAFDVLDSYTAQVGYNSPCCHCSYHN